MRSHFSPVLEVYRGGGRIRLPTQISRQERMSEKNYQTSLKVSLLGSLRLPAIESAFKSPENDSPSPPTSILFNFFYKKQI